MDLNQFMQYFDNPKVSVFPRMADKSFPMRIGKFYPAYWELLGFGNSGQGTSGHKLRMAPMLAPNFSNITLQEHTSVVPLRVIMKDYEAKFNYALNREGANLPNINLLDLNLVYRVMLQHNIPVIGSLFDFFGFPTYSNLYNTFRSQLYHFYQNSVDENLVDLSIPFLNLQTYPQLYENYVGHYNASHGELDFRDRTLTTADFVNFTYFALGIHDIGFDPSVGIVHDFYQTYGSNPDGSISTTFIPTIEQLVEFSDYETVDSLVNAYLNYAFSFVVSEYMSDPIDGEQTFSTLPFRAFWRTFYDWCTNGNFTDRDSLLEKYVFNFETQLVNLANAIYEDPNDESFIDELRFMTQVPMRLWDNDFFTSLLPSSAVDNAIEIPANATVLDLANLTAIQKFVLKLSYSSRYRDVVWNVFKIRPSDARLQQSSIVRKKYHNVGIGETLQTSETSVGGVLGSFAGRGYSSGLNKGYHVFCEEPCVLINFVSLMPKAVYKDSLHPLIHTSDIMDFPIPDMDVLGNQPIYADLASGDPNDSQVVMGYGRQYMEWLSMYSTVHGDFKTTLDYWNLTRSFADTPVLNDDFLRMSDADDFDDIFSVPNAPHAFLDIYYNTRVTRHVHRSVRIQI